MNLQTIILGLIGLFLVLAAFFYLQKKPAPPARRHVETNSSTVKTKADGKLTRLADAAFATRWLVAKPGATPATGIAVGTANALPLGVCADEPAAGESAAVYLFGVTHGTFKAQGGGAIAAGAQVYTGPTGYLVTLPGASGTYYLVGTALTATTNAGDEFELQHCYPQKVVVP